MKQISETPTGNSDLKDGVSTVVDEVASVSRFIYIYIFLLFMSETFK